MSDSRPRTVVSRLQARINHLERLQHRDSGFVVEDANAALRDLYDGGPRPASILLRRSFLARSTFLMVEGDRDKTPRQKPPAARIVRSRGLALRLELALVFAQQSRKNAGARLLPVQAPGDDLGLINLFATGTRRGGDTLYRKQRSAMRADQVHNALEILAAEGLVELGTAGRNRFEPMWLCHEAGRRPGKDAARYTHVAPAERTVSIPVEFFTNGWIQVLTDSEIWAWLVFRSSGGMTSADIHSAEGIELTAVTRLGWYELTRDAWDTHAMLDRFGMLTTQPGEVTTGVKDGQQRFERAPHRFHVDDEVLKQPAHPAALAAVAAELDHTIDKTA